MSDQAAKSFDDLSSLTMVHDHDGTWSVFVPFSAVSGSFQAAGLADPFECIEQVANWLGLVPVEHTIPVSVAPGGLPEAPLEERVARAAGKVERVAKAKRTTARTRQPVSPGTDGPARRAGPRTPKRRSG